MKKFVYLCSLCLTLAACGGGGGGGTGPEPGPVPGPVGGAQTFTTAETFGDGVSIEAANVTVAGNLLSSEAGSNSVQAKGGGVGVGNGSFVIFNQEGKLLTFEVVDKLSNGFQSAEMPVPKEGEAGFDGFMTAMHAVAPYLPEPSDTPQDYVDDDGSVYHGTVVYGYAGEGVPSRQTLVLASQEVDGIQLDYSTFGWWTFSVAGRGDETESPEGGGKVFKDIAVNEQFYAPIFGGDMDRVASPEAGEFSGPAYAMAEEWYTAYDSREIGDYRARALKGTASLTVDDPSSVSRVELAFPGFYDFVYSGDFDLTGGGKLHVTEADGTPSFTRNNDPSLINTQAGLANGEFNLDNIDSHDLEAQFYGVDPAKATEAAGAFEINGHVQGDVGWEYHVRGSFGVNPE